MQAMEGKFNMKKIIGEFWYAMAEMAIFGAGVGNRIAGVFIRLGKYSVARAIRYGNDNN